MLQAMETEMLSITKIADNIAIIADEFQISKADLFGPCANGTATETSVVDILIEFHPSATITYLLKPAGGTDWDRSKCDSWAGAY